MNIINIYSEYKKPIVLALGFFDCVHTGHKSILNEVFELAGSLNAESSVFTFSTDPSKLINKEPQVYTFQDRTTAFENLGVENVLNAEFTSEFSKLSAVQFLNLLITHFNVKAFVAGRDYRFGANADGNTTLLAEFAKNNNISVKIVEFTKSFNVKVSTSALKNLIKSGNISTLNSLLTEPYFMRGEVVHGKNRGAQMGFPTANIIIPPNRYPLEEGVYITRIFVDGNVYDSMTNVGIKPTFNDLSPTVETHIFDFNRNIYGKTVKLIFLKRLRGVIKFNSQDEIKRQLITDAEDTMQFFAQNCIRNYAEI